MTNNSVPQNFFSVFFKKAILILLFFISNTGGLSSLLNLILGGINMRKKKFNFTEVVIGFACPQHMERRIIEEGKRLCDTKSGIIRRALMFYFDNANNERGGESCYGKQI